MSRLRWARCPIIAKTVAIAQRRGDQFVKVDILEAGDAHIDIGPPQHVRRVDPVVDMNAATWAKEMMRDWVAAAIVGALAGNAKVLRLRPHMPESRFGAVGAVAFD